MTDLTETVQKPTFWYTLKPAIMLPITQLAILMFLLHESLGRKHIYTVEKAEDQ